jgi:hypothetical protein
MSQIKRTAKIIYSFLIIDSLYQKAPFFPNLSNFPLL